MATFSTINGLTLTPAALERLVTVADQAARYALTTATVQNGDTVQQTDTGELWYVIDDTQLGVAGGYAVYTAGTASAAPWSGITGKPTTFAYTDAINAFTKQQNVTPQTLTSTTNSIAWNLDLGNVGEHVATENTTLAAPSNPVNGGVYTFIWRQHASAAKTLAFNAIFQFGASGSTVSVTVGTVHIFTGVYLTATGKIHMVMSEAL